MWKGKKVRKIRGKRQKEELKLPKPQDILLMRTILEWVCDLIGMLHRLVPLILGITLRCWCTFLQKSDSWEMVHTCIFSQNEVKVPPCTWELRKMVLTNIPVKKWKLLSLLNEHFGSLLSPEDTDVSTVLLFLRKQRETLFSYEKYK